MHLMDKEGKLSMTLPLAMIGGSARCVRTSLRTSSLSTTAAIRRGTHARRSGFASSPPGASNYLDKGPCDFVRAFQNVC